MSQDLGRLVLRLAIGAMLLLHGIDKLRHGVGQIPAQLEPHGLPGWVAYLVYVGEVIGPLLMILGKWTRLGAAAVVVNMGVALWLVHGSTLLALGKKGGWTIELQALYLFGALAVLLLGGGRYGIGRGEGRLS